MRHKLFGIIQSPVPHRTLSYKPSILHFRFKFKYTLVNGLNIIISCSLPKTTLIDLYIKYS